MGYYDTINKAAQADAMMAKKLYEQGVTEGAQIGAARAVQLLQQRMRQQQQMQPYASHYTTGKLGISPQIINQIRQYEQEIEQQHNSPITQAAHNILKQIS